MFFGTVGARQIAVAVRIHGEVAESPHARGKGLRQRSSSSPSHEGDSTFVIHMHGEVAEWFKAPVLKTGDSQGSVSSNLTLSARKLSVKGGLYENLAIPVKNFSR